MHFSDYKFLGALACAVAAAACVGQSRAGNLDVKSLAYHGKIPYVVSDDNRVAQRINNVIFLDALEIVPPATFKDGMPKGGSSPPFERISEVSFRVVRNDFAILSLSISFEWCGAYCEDNVVHRNFVAATGAYIVSADLITAAGAVDLSKRLDEPARRFISSYFILRNVFFVV